MSINKYSSIDDICNFLSPILNNDEIIQRFKTERIKGNELYYLTDNDYDTIFKIKIKKKKLKAELENIAKDNKNIKDYEEKIYTNSNEEQVYNFLKKEFLLEENIIEKFRGYDGKKLKNLKENNLIELDLKVGERRKILDYTKTMESKEIKNNENNTINITKNSTKEEVYAFLKNKFTLPKEILDEFLSIGITGKEFFDKEIISEFQLNDKAKKEIFNYIDDYNNKSEEEEDEIIDKEEEFKYFHLIDIIEYLTSEEEYSKCPFNKKEGFIELCNFMGIENKDNCTKINFEQASKINIKISTIWGSKESLFEFFESKKMKNVLEFFKNNKNDSGGIYLLINMDKSFAYNLIWPGKMNYLYKKLDEPQKDLLLSLVRIGFSLSNDNIICLSEKQKNEFDFKKIKELKSEGIFRATEGKLATQSEENYFKLGEESDIKYSLQTEKIKKFKLNNSSIFLYISKNESVNFEVYDKIPNSKLNFNAENIILNENFELTEVNLYNFIKEFDCLKNLKQDELYSQINQLCKTTIEDITEIYVNNLSKYINKIQHYKYQCEHCHQNKDKLYAYHCKKHGFHIYHQNCQDAKPLNENTDSNSKLYLQNKKFLYDIIFNLVTFFYQNLPSAHKKYTDLNNIILDFLSKFKEKNIIIGLINSYIYDLNNLLTKIKNHIEKEKNNILKEDDDIKSLFIDWKKELIKEINEIHKSKYDNLSIWYEFTNAYYDINEKKYYYTFKKYKKDAQDDIIKLYNIYKNNNDEKYLLKDKEEKRWDKNNKGYEFENYFERENGGIYIKNIDKDLYEVNLNNRSIKFNGCYDYFNNILILSRKEQNKMGIYINIYYLDGEKKFNYNTKGKYINYLDNIFMIKIVHFKFKNTIYFLLFSNNLISLMDENFIYITDIKLSEIYKNYDLNQLQFLVYQKFLLIFSFSKKKEIINVDNNGEENKNSDNIWNLDIFEIDTNKITKKKEKKGTKSDSNMNEEKNKKKEEDKIKLLNFTKIDGIFSISNVKVSGKDVPVLYFCYLENKNFNIKLIKILSNLSGSTVEINSNNSQYLNLAEGNCVMNYFYHIFLKYPSLGALQYNYYNNKKPKKNIYLFAKGLKLTEKFKNYLTELKDLCIKERQFNASDIDYEFQGLFRRDKIITNLNFDLLIQNFIKVIPLQIAKIKNHYFKTMSNGKDIKIDELFEMYSKNKEDIDIKLKTDEIAKNINFGMLNSIFNFYDLPVVVLAFMGAQSIGKSTLSNELVESFFNVSGMRCTEGIWMAVSLFKGIKNIKKCEDKCKCCGENCRLFIHSTDIDCICENCCCEENCCLLFIETNIKQNQHFCNKRCSLPLGHDKICKIHFDPDNKKCFKHNEKKCQCPLDEIERREHLCDISPYNHGFICVSLDFEGLGTFERSYDQDIDLAMIGAALANSLILRADKTFDTFMEGRIIDWSEASNKIKKTNNFNKNIHFFGGNIIFCQKDIPQNNYEEVKKEFEDKMSKAIETWKEKEMDKNLNNNDNDIIINEKQIFGIFSKYINSPTPIFNKIEFYSTLRKELIHLIIRNVLMSKSRPYYRTGTEFMSFLKKILAIVEIHDYNALDNVAFDNLQKYLADNKNKAIEIFGIYPNQLEDKNFNNIEELEEYLDSNLEHLKSSLISTTKLKIDETIYMNIISPNLKKCENINYKNKNFILKISENQNELNSYKLEIQGIKEYGLLLLIPSKYNEKFGLENIRENLFSLWKVICNNLNLSNLEAIDYFRTFSSELIKRRKNNINKWLDNLISSFTEIDVKPLKQFDFSLLDRWKICKEKCHYCNYKCVKILGHPGNHNCGFDHICHEKCQICEIIKCNVEDCKCNCQYKEEDKYKSMPSGHEQLNSLPKGILHSCSHFHKCQKKCDLINLRGCDKNCKLEYGHKEEKCSCKSNHLCNEKCCYNEYSKECNIKCSLPYKHAGEHKCDIKEHLCNKDCEYKNNSKGCKEKCNLKLPHTGISCRCDGDHYCKKYCSLKDKSRGCDNECIKPYPHQGECNCGKKHICKAKCSYKEKSRGCNENGVCNLQYGHEKEKKGKIHNCGAKHFCIKDCFYKDKANNCKNNKKCTLEYDHKGKCTCGAEQHICKKKCLINNCGENCNLPYNHKGPCNCKGKHYCKKNCHLLKYSTEDSCHKKCILLYGHKEKCKCDLPIENHKCNKTCKCGKNCSLIANHEDENCLCGNCQCDKGICHLNDKSRNCHGKCVMTYGHKGLHLCDLNEKEHLCNKECIYKERTSSENGGCLGKCKLPFDHEGDNHFCENPKEKHICNKECSLKNDSFPESCHKLCSKSIDHEPPCLCTNKPEDHKCNKKCHLNDIKGCKSNCNLPVHHKEECLCSAGNEGHLCSKECSLFTKSREGCNKDCSLPYNHKGECFCSSNKNDHKCNKICSLKENTRKGCCYKICKDVAGHPGACFCLLSKENHFCNKSCSLKEKSREGSCTGKCSLNTGHDGECICSSDKHICNHECDYKKSSRDGCFLICSKETNHDGVHKCMKELKEHICNQMCHYSEVSRNCKKLCKKYLGHEGNHLCDENNHLCSGDCYLSKICHKGVKFCNKPAGHKERHDCEEDKEHICNKECSLKDKSRVCSSKCSLRYDHKKLDNTDCICEKAKNEHLCTKKCEFCKGDVYCGFVCDHNNDGHHFCCDREHDCEGTCEQDGICIITTEKSIKKRRVQILQFGRESIEFEDKDGQEKGRLKCKIKIPKNEYMHEGKHKCELKIHKCGFSCRQCNNLCELNYGHFDENNIENTLHKCINHGHINNANILTEENSVKLAYQNNFYDFINEESPNMFTCYNYCKQQGRGHIHIIEKSHLDKVNNIDLFAKYFRNRNDGLYECKCEFFWKYILNFEFQFDDQQTESFKKCPAYCPLCEEIDSNKTYCDNDLWHEPFTDSNNDIDYWISKEGHKFKCHHPIPCHTIFIIDKSGSMSREDIQPNLPNIRQNKNFNNRMGRLIESMNNYIIKRKKISQNDLFSVISFSDNAEIILSGNISDSTEEFDFVEECMKKIKECKGDTKFYLGFEKSREILDSIDRANYKPVIILFSDGADEEPKKTIEIINKVSIFYF